MNMKKVIVFIACIFISLSMLFALDTSTVGNVSLNVRMESVAIGFVKSEEEAKNATNSTPGTTNLEIGLSPNGTEFDYNGKLTFWFSWKIMTSETSLKVSLSADGPLILEGKNISNAEDYQKIDYIVSAKKSSVIKWMGQEEGITETITGSNYASETIDIKIKDSTNPQIYTQGVCKVNLNLTEQIKTKAYGNYGCKLTLKVTNI